MNRKTEIRNLLSLSPDEVRQQAGEKLVVCVDLDTLHQQMAEDICSEIEANNAAGQPTRLILPVGPTGQYQLLAAMIAERAVSLEQCWFFFMDEYCDDDSKAIPATHPLSFKRIAHELFLDRLPETSHLQPERVIFPDETNIDQLAPMIANVGGIDTCYGGIGIHGHVAFNEPEAGVRESQPRKVRLNDFTVTINAIRAQIGGDLVNFPREAYTLGMQQILNARRIRLYCRNSTDLDWANAVLRLALLGSPADDYPVTHIRHHADYVITTNEYTLQSPKYIL